MTQFKNAEQYLKVADQFQLGPLITEAPHSLTTDLSELSKKDLLTAMKKFKAVDLDALNLFFKNTEQIQKLSKDVHETLEAGANVYLVGCGATGRLSLNIERISRELDFYSGRIKAFMAGGDIALVHSLEGFEDKVEFGEKHLMQKGFNKKDLLIAITEGGETPYVIGAVNKAAEVSTRKPYFLYCNPDKVLKNVERSKKVLENEKINKLNLTTGPMALAGSTRLQASTVQMLAVGMALFFKNQKEREYNFREFYKFYTELDLSPFQSFIIAEENAYLKNSNVVYTVNASESIVVFTDTTERSPTFSLAPFEPRGAELKSLCYISIKGTDSQEQSWQALLSRLPEQLDWIDVDERTSKEYITGFDFSDTVRDWRQQTKNIVDFEILNQNGLVDWKIETQKLRLNLTQFHRLFQNVTLKMLLNMHSTLLMGRMGRYKSNIMTWVRPSNGKLIDRTARCVLWLLQQKLIFDITYSQVIHQIFASMPDLSSDEPLVLNVYESLLESYYNKAI